MPIKKIVHHVRKKIVEIIAIMDFYFPREMNPQRFNKEIEWKIAMKGIKHKPAFVYVKTLVKSTK